MSATSSTRSPTEQRAAEWKHEELQIHAALTHAPLDVAVSMARVRSPAAGAIVMFAGTTRDNFQGEKVVHLTYSAYIPLAIRTLSKIATELHTKHNLQGISISHRLGTVPIGEESILICVSSAHRGASFRAAEEALEEAKAKVEVWKKEHFVSGSTFEGRDGDGVWRANKEWDQDGRRRGAKQESATAGS